MLRRVLGLAVLLLACCTLAYGATITKGLTVTTTATGGPYGYAAGDSLVPQTADTSAVVTIKNMQNISAWIQCDADTTAVSIQLSMDGTVWESFVNAGYYKGTTGTTAVLFHKYLNLTGINGTDYGGAHLGNFLRFILKCNDVASRAASDGVKSISYYVQGDAN